MTLCLRVGLSYDIASESWISYDIASESWISYDIASESWFIIL